MADYLTIDGTPVKCDKEQMPRPRRIELIDRGRAVSGALREDDWGGRKWEIPVVQRLVPAATAEALRAILEGTGMRTVGGEIVPGGGTLTCRVEMQDEDHGYLNVDGTVALYKALRFMLLEV